MNIQQTPEIRFAVEAVESAALLASRIRSGLSEPSLEKSDNSPVTVADLAVQALVARLLLGTFPDDPLVAEEDSSEVDSPLGRQLLQAAAGFLRNVFPDATPERVREWIKIGEGNPGRGRFWTLDPIDGTKGFLRGDQYAVALSLVADGTPQVGVLGCPNLDFGEGRGVLALGVRHGGAWAAPLGRRSFAPLSVSDTRAPRDALVVRSVESGHTDTEGFALLVRRLGSSKPPLLMDSQAKYAVLAAGRGDLLLRMIAPARPGYKEKIWDHAAGSLIVEEAGGKVTDLRGRPLDFSKGRRLESNVGVAASNGVLHDTALEALEASQLV